MKIVHVAFSPKGGAGIAAMRQHLALLDSGVDSSFLSVVPDSSGSPQTYTYPALKYSLLERILIRLYSYRQHQKNERLLKRATGTSDKPSVGYSFPWTDFHVESHQLIQEADIINLHWVCNFINYPTFFKTVTKPIVWTLHDLNPIQGGFHYEDRQGVCAELLSLEEDIVARKKLCYNDSSIRGIVGPSNWIADCSRNSELLGKYSHTNIPYSLDTKLFKYSDQTSARKALGLPENKQVFLYVSDKIGDYRKGFDILVEAVKPLIKKYGLHLAAIGEPGDWEDANITYLGSIYDEHKLAQAYSAADMFLLPSREDNLPNVMLESLCCGTPCIGTPVGGIPEVVVNGVNGYVSADLSVEGYRREIEKFLLRSEPFDRKKISADAHAEFHYEIQAKRYIKLYNDLLSDAAV